MRHGIVETKCKLKRLEVHVLITAAKINENHANYMRSLPQSNHTTQLRDTIAVKSYNTTT